MRFSVFTHVIHTRDANNFFAYAPYVREMNLWIASVNKVTITAPFSKESPQTIDSPYLHDKLFLKKISPLYFKNLSGILKSMIALPAVLFTIYKEMKVADHIHIRCPGNIGLLACILQAFFPGKKKTAKYAGNWDPDSMQPWSYRIQKWILSNTFLTRNMKVLVYGKWDNTNENIVSFFTASYSENERINSIQNYSEPFKFIYSGTLTEGKRPLLAVRIIHRLIEKGTNVCMNIYGDGPMKLVLEKYIKDNSLDDSIFLCGNREAEVLKKAYNDADFVILPSKSEGWPKALAEGMFFGCIPISTNISCVGWMLDQGKRGLLVNPELEQASGDIMEFLNRPGDFLIQVSKNAQKWSQQYTLEKFEREIKKFL